MEDRKKDQKEENHSKEDMEKEDHSSTHSSTHHDQPAIPRIEFGSWATKNKTPQTITDENMVGDKLHMIITHRFGSNSSLWEHTYTPGTAERLAVSPAASHKQHSACTGSMGGTHRLLADRPHSYNTDSDTSSWHVGPPRSAVDGQTNTINCGTLRHSDSADGGADDNRGLCQSVFTSHQPSILPNSSRKAGERPTRPPVVTRSTVDGQTNTFDCVLTVRMAELMIIGGFVNQFSPPTSL